MSVKFKDFAIKEASDEGNGGFTGYAATFDREPDCYGDVIAKGAFDETLRKWAESGKPVPLLYGHNMYDPDYNIGTAELSVDEKGLLAVASFDGSAKAQRVRELVKDGRLYKMSFAYDVLEAGAVVLDGGRKANELRKLDVFEVSVVLVPANSHAEIFESKSREKYGATISKATSSELEAAMDAIESLMGSLEQIGKTIEESIEQAKDACSRIRTLIGGGEEDKPSDEGEEEGENANSDAKSGEVIARLQTLIS